MDIDRPVGTADLFTNEADDAHFCQVESLVDKLGSAYLYDRIGILA